MVAQNAEALPFWTWVKDSASHLVLPVFCLTYGGLAALSRFAAANAATVDSIDVNPLRVFAEGEGACMLDALIQFAAPVTDPG